jgi:hypothetical protein
MILCDDSGRGDDAWKLAYSRRHKKFFTFGIIGLMKYDGRLFRLQRKELIYGFDAWADQWGDCRSWPAPAGEVLICFLADCSSNFLRLSD